MALAHRVLTVVVTLLAPVICGLVFASAGCGPRDNPPSERSGGGAPGAAWPDSGPASGGGDSAGAAEPRPVHPDSVSDPRAVSFAARVMNAVGGERAWASAGCLHFTYVEGDSIRERLRRTHYWERASARHRMEGTDAQGRKLVLIHTLGDSTMILATRAGSPVTGAKELRALRAQAEAAWLNDSFWLLAPFRLRDPGVRLAYDGTESEGDRDWDLIAVTFERPGMAPRDRYLIFVNRATGLIDRWAFVPERRPAASKPVAFDWSGWRRFGGIQLADLRREVGSARRISFPQLAVSDDLPPATFSSPEPVAIPAL